MNILKCKHISTPQKKKKIFIRFPDDYTFKAKNKWTTVKRCYKDIILITLS